MKLSDFLFSRTNQLVITGVCILSLLAIHACNEPEKETPPVVPVIIEDFTPRKGQIGTIVVITGSNFSTKAGGNKVTFNGIEATISSESATSITTMVPPKATPGKIIVVADGKEATSVTDFFVILPPVISSFTPAKGPQRTVVTILGSNFNLIAANNHVSIGVVPLLVSEPTTTSLKATIPAEAMTGKIAIDINGLIGVSAVDFVVTPLIEKVEPETGSIGTVVTISGSGFSPTVAGNIVKFGTVTATVSEASSLSLKVTVPTGAVTGRVSVTTGGNSIESRTDFVVE